MGRLAVIGPRAAQALLRKRAMRLRSSSSAPCFSGSHARLITRFLLLLPCRMMLLRFLDDRAIARELASGFCARAWPQASPASGMIEPLNRLARISKAVKSRGLMASALWTASSARAGLPLPRRIAAIAHPHAGSSGCSPAACSSKHARSARSRGRPSPDRHHGQLGTFMPQAYSRTFRSRVQEREAPARGACDSVSSARPTAVNRLGHLRIARRADHAALRRRPRVVEHALVPCEAQRIRQSDEAPRADPRPSPRT